MDDLGDDPYGLETLGESSGRISFHNFIAGIPPIQISHADTRRLSVAPTLFDGVLAEVGILKAGFRYPVGKFTPHARNFSIFSTGYYSYKQQLVRSFSLPPMSAELISSGILTSMSFESGAGVLNYGQSQTTYTCGGVRGKIDGQEVIQFVVRTDSYVHAFLYDTDRIIRLENVYEPARYEKKDGRYYLLGGSPAAELNAVPHPWYYPTHEGIEHSRTHEGVILNVNGLEYKVKDQRSATLMFSKGRVLDYNGKMYTVREIEIPLEDDELFEADFELPEDEQKRTAKYLVSRPDKLIPDTTNSIDRLVKAPNVTDLLSRAPYSYSPPEIVEPEYTVVSSTSYDTYRAMTHRLSGVGPSTWSSIVPTPLVDNAPLPLTSESLIRTMISHGASVITYSRIQRECDRLGISLLGQSIRDITYRPPRQEMELDGFNLSNVAPESGDFRFESFQFGQNPMFDINFRESFIVCRDVKLLILFRTRALSHVSVPCPPISFSAVLLHNFIRASPSPTNVLCRQFNQSRGVMLTMLEGHPELFRKDERNKPPLWRANFVN